MKVLEKIWALVQNAEFDCRHVDLGLGTIEEPMLCRPQLVSILEVADRKEGTYVHNPTVDVSKLL